MPVLAEIQLILDLLNSIEPPPPPKDEAELLDRVRAQIGMVQEPVNESLAVASVENVILEWDGLKISARVYKPLNQPWSICMAVASVPATLIHTTVLCADIAGMGR